MREHIQAEKDEEIEPASFWNLLRRKFWDLLRGNLILLVGISPGILLTVWGIWGRSLPLTLLGGMIGGLAGGPLLCGLYGTILCAIRWEPGFWSLLYKRTLKQSWKNALLPGTLVGAILALWLFEAILLGTQGPVPLFVVVVLVEVLFFLFGITNYVFPLLAAGTATAGTVYFQSIRLWMGNLPRTAAAAAAKTAYWIVFLLLLPRSIPLLALAGFWLPCLLSMVILIDPMNEILDLDLETGR